MLLPNVKETIWKARSRLCLGRCFAMPKQCPDLEFAETQKKCVRGLRQFEEVARLLHAGERLLRHRIQEIPLRRFRVGDLSAGLLKTNPADVPFTTDAQRCFYVIITLPVSVTSHPRMTKRLMKF